MGVIEQEMNDNFNSTPHMLPAAGEVNLSSHSHLEAAH